MSALFPFAKLGTVSSLLVSSAALADFAPCNSTSCKHLCVDNGGTMGTSAAGSTCFTIAAPLAESGVRERPRDPGRYRSPPRDPASYESSQRTAARRTAALPPEDQVQAARAPLGARPRLRIETGGTPILTGISLCNDSDCKSLCVGLGGDLIESSSGGNTYCVTIHEETSSGTSAR